MVGGSFLLCATFERGRGAGLLFTSCEGKATGMRLTTSFRAGRGIINKTDWLGLWRGSSLARTAEVLLFLAVPASH